MKLDPRADIHKFCLHFQRGIFKGQVQFFQADFAE